MRIVSSLSDERTHASGVSASQSLILQQGRRLTLRAGLTPCLSEGLDRWHQRYYVVM